MGSKYLTCDDKPGQILRIPVENGSPQDVEIVESNEIIFSSHAAGVDIGPQLQSIVNSTSDGATIRISASDTPYTWTTTVIVRSHLKMVVDAGATIEFVCVYGLDTGIIAFTCEGKGGTSSMIGVLTSTVGYGNPVWPMSSVAGLAVDDYIFANGEGGRFSARVVSIVGLNVTVDEAYWDELTGSVFKTDIIQEFEFENNGLIRGYFTGVFTDSRLVYTQPSWHCRYTGTGTYEITQSRNPQGILGFDLGGRENYAGGFRLIGSPDFTPDLLGTGVAIEGQQRSVVENIRAFRMGPVVWLNMVHACQIDEILCDHCFAITSISGNITPTGIGCHGNQYGKLTLSNPVAGGYGIWLGHDSRNNNFESIRIIGKSTIANYTALYIGANGSKRCNDNTFGTIDVEGIDLVINHGVGGTGNSVKKINVKNCNNAAIVTGNSELSIANLSGSLTNGITFTVLSSQLTVDEISIDLAGTTGRTFCNSNDGATVKISNATITHSGTGYAYGFLAASPGRSNRVQIRDSDLGAWATNSFAMQTADEIDLISRVTYSGTVAANTILNRQNRALNGATPVIFPVPFASATSRVTATRVTTGGTPGAAPAISVIPRVATETLNLATAFLANLTQATTGVFREDTATSSHYFVKTIAGWSTACPVIVRYRAQAVGRNFIVISDDGPNYTSFNLATGAILSNNGAAVGSIAANVGGAGIHDCYVYVPTWGSANISVYLSTDGTTLSYTGGGATVGANVLLAEATRLGYVSATGIVGDTSQYALEVA